ncbi:MAG: beta-phosphoglucomutase [Spirochaetaceae bacterium]|nr:beta-phosphoglucomutase [Spirochaetaceae bacterium]
MVPALSVRGTATPGAVLFDLDGVVTDTAGRHSAAWRRLALELRWRFDEDLHDALRGVGRLDALAMLARRNGLSLPADEATRLADRKNGYYVESLAGLRPADILPGVERLLDELEAAGIRTALASASRNAPAIIAMLGIARRFTAVVDPDGMPGKPHPAIFLEAARLVGSEPSLCVGIEDAQAGVDAIKAAGMKAVAVGGDLRGADAAVGDTEGLTLGLLMSLFAAREGGP